MRADDWVDFATYLARGLLSLAFGFLLMVLQSYRHKMDSMLARSVILLGASALLGGVERLLASAEFLGYVVPPTFLIAYRVVSSLAMLALVVRTLQWICILKVTVPVLPQRRSR